jgi:hypothetical protein
MFSLNSFPDDHLISRPRSNSLPYTNTNTSSIHNNDELSMVRKQRTYTDQIDTNIKSLKTSFPTLKSDISLQFISYHDLTNIVSLREGYFGICYRYKIYHIIIYYFQIPQIFIIFILFFSYL